MRRLRAEINNSTRLKLRHWQAVDEATGKVAARPPLSAQEMERLRNHLRSQLRRRLGRQ
jgi:hypothetical protein